MTDNMNEFLKKVSSSKELQGKFASLTDPKEVHKLALTVQPGLTLNEVIDAMKELTRYRSSMSELTDEELKQVAGGTYKYLSSSDPYQEFTALDQYELNNKGRFLFCFATW